MAQLLLPCQSSDDTEQAGIYCFHVNKLQGRHGVVNWPGTARTGQSEPYKKTISLLAIPSAVPLEVNPCIRNDGAALSGTLS